MDKKKKIQMIVGMLVFLLAGILYLGMNDRQEKSETVTEHFADQAEERPKESDRSTSDPVQKESGGAADGTLVYIHICGAVKKPGVYTFAEEPHIVDVVKQAGGFTKKADQTSVNLAERVADGTQLVIASKNRAPVTKEDSGSHHESSGSDTSGKVNINTASEQELMTLSGIGESKASQIVAYRTSHGAFQKIEDIMNISGIKEGVFSKIQDFITV